MFKKYVLTATAVLLLATGTSILGSTAANAAMCSSEQLSSSSTIKGVAFNAGTRQASSTDFNGSGSSNMGSITLTEAQASGNGVTSIVATGSATATWLHVGPSINSWGNDDISTTADLAGVTLAYGELFEIKISGTGCTDYYRISITVPSSRQNGQQSAQQAAAAAQAEAAAFGAGQQLKKTISAQQNLSTAFLGNKSGSIEDFSSANINVTTTASLNRINAEILKLSAIDRTDFAKIKALAEKIEFDESFFNASSRPTASTYATYGVPGVTDRIVAKVNEKVLELPAAQRLDTKAITEIANVESFIDRVASTETRSSVSASLLVSKGLLPADYSKKHSLIQSLGSYPEGSLNTMAKIEAAIKEQIANAEAPRLRTAEIRARIAARNK
jgi:hypothetical protein